MIPWMWNLDKMAQDAENRALINGDSPEGLNAAELLARCEERERRFAENAIAAERDGDEQGTWFAMAARAENKRLMDRLKSDIVQSVPSAHDNQPAHLISQTPASSLPHGTEDEEKKNLEEPGDAR